MVRLYVSLLAVTLAAGPALAFSDEYERRSELDSNLYEREFVDSQEMPITREDYEDLYGRDVFDDFEAREPNWLSLAGKGARALAHHGAKHGDTALNLYSSYSQNKQNSRREISDALEAREPNWLSLAGKGARALAHHGAKHGDSALNLYGSYNQNSRREISDDLEAREPVRFGSSGRMSSRFGGSGGGHGKRRHHFRPSMDQSTGDNSQNSRREISDDLD